MDWATILRIGFSGFAFAVLYFGYRKFEKENGSAKLFAGFGIVLSVLVIASSFVDKAFNARRPETVLAACRSELELLKTHAGQVKPEDLVRLPAIVRAKTQVCEDAFTQLEVK